MVGTRWHHEEDGVVASCEQRGLPLENLRDEYYTASFTDKAAELLKERGITIEVSRIERAFGREGGALQTRIKDANGDAIAGEKLAEYGVLNG